MCGPETVAEFTVVITILSVVSLVTAGFTTVFLPMVTKMRVKNEQGSLLKATNSGTKLLNIMLSFVVFILVLDVKEVISIYVGESFEHLAKWVVFALLILLLMHRNVMTALVYTERKLTIVSIMGFVAMSVAFVLYFIFIPKYGLGGVFIGWLGHELVHTLFYYLYFIPAKLNINVTIVFVKSVLPTWSLYTGITLVLYWLFTLFALSAWASCIIKGVIYVLLIIPMTWFFLLDKEERGVIQDLIIKKETTNGEL